MTIYLERLRIPVDGAVERSRDSGRDQVDGADAGERSLGALEPARTTGDGPAKLTGQIPVNVQVGSSAEPFNSTKSRSPFAASNVAIPENVFAAKSTQCGYVAVNRPRCEPVPVNVSVSGTASQTLGFPGVTSNVPAYFRVIGTVTAADAGTAKSAAHRHAAARRVSEGH